MKKINFLGDSITEGACAEQPHNMYSYLVSEHFHAEECNFGISGTRIARQFTPSTPDIGNDETFIERAVKMPKDADFTFCMGGTNDYGHGDAPLGKFGDTNSASFYGAMDELTDYLKREFGEKLCFVLPLYRYNQENVYGDGRKKTAGATLLEYIEAEKQVLDKYGVEYLDLSRYFPEPKTNAGDEITADGLHPNIKGHKLLADLLIEYLEKNKKI